MEEEKSENPGNQKVAEEKSQEVLEKEMVKTFLDDLQSNPKYKSFFERYQPNSISGFQEHWAREKASIYKWKEYYTSQAEKVQVRYIELAKKKLWEIQQRKLFDLQCRWRANQIEIPDVYTTMDFRYWEMHIKTCPFLSRITEEELNRYIGFVEQADYDDVLDAVYSDVQWQEYNDFKRYYMGNKDVYYEPPPWYEYYELVTGLSNLYLLEDIKGSSEENYAKCFRENRDKDNNEKPYEPYVPDPRPKLFYYESENIEEFVKNYEDFNTYYLYRCAEDTKSSYVDDNIRKAIEILNMADEEIYLSQDKEWYESIIDGAYDYERRRLVRELPAAYKSYLFRIENKIPFEEKENDDKEWFNRIRMEYREQILTGRELMGEPRDFNY